MREKAKLDSNPIPVRLDEQQLGWLTQLQDTTDLSKSFIIRRCVNYALQRFIHNQVDILTLQEKQ
ncbi:MAG: hypothetical protein LBH01_08235 [Verrucomicrobiales bacterium]|nr:hypothetical protein [Verrucomicrobiales bacterium]